MYKVNLHEMQMQQFRQQLETTLLSPETNF
jgi:hypothetical protein